MLYDNPLNNVQHQAPAPASPIPAPAPVTPGAAYAPPQAAGPMLDYHPIESFEDDTGNYGYGIFWGLIGGLIIFLIVMSTAKSETKRGAVHAFCAKMVLGFLVYGFILMGSG